MIRLQCYIVAGLQLYVLVIVTALIYTVVRVT